MLAINSKNKKNIELSNKPKVYALFSGAGGFHLGLESAGFEILVASDISVEAEKTHNKNLPHILFIREDARKLTSKRLLEAARHIKPDLIIGGPPCQGFSTLGDKNSSDPRNNLFEEFARIVKDLKPKYFLLENVKSLTTMYQGRFKDHIIETFERIGYKVTWKVLDAADYGVPQFRKRVFFFGTLESKLFKFPEPTHGEGRQNKFITTWEAIKDLEKKGATVPNHSALNHSEIVVERYKLIPEGGKLPPPKDLPLKLRRGNFGNTYKRLSRKEPSLTMVPGNNAFPIHPTLHRSLTPREAARLQSFPDDYIFEGDRRSQCILVGNAVPPRLSAAIGKSILNLIKSPIIKLQEVTEDEKIKPTQKLKRKNSNDCFIDLFSGAGGITLGLKRAGWNPLLSCDINKDANNTHINYFKNVEHIDGDLSDQKIRDKIVRQLKDLDLGILAGGPPCQGFSMFGKRRFVNSKGYKPEDDPRNKLVYSFIDVVKRTQPRWFIMENVPGLANLDDGLFLQELIKKFKKAGYKNCEAKILNAADYGVPQLRRRLLIIGNRTGHIIPWPKKKFFAMPEDWQDPHRTVGEIISDLADDSSYEEFANHVPMKHKPLLVERYKYIPEGGRLDVEALPANLKKGYRTDKVKNYSHIFKRLHRNQPSITMVPGHNAFPIHPWLNRALTVREAARIQTFPDAMLFLGSRQEQCIQVGNAFPPLLAEVLGNNIKKAEVNGWFPGKVPKSAFYSLIDSLDDDSEK